MEAIKKIVGYDQENGALLTISSFLDTQTIDRLIELNQERNSFSHISALTDDEAKKRLEELFPIVNDVLFELSFLQDVRLLRYVGNNGGAMKIRFNKFDGHSLQKHNYDVALSSEELTKYAPCLVNDVILAEFRDVLCIVSPFIHFTGEGGHTRLCYFKTVEKDTGNLTFEIIGGKEREVSISQASLANGIHNQLEGVL